jgi:hypothetical protein
MSRCKVKPKKALSGITHLDLDALPALSFHDLPILPQFGLAYYYFPGSSHPQ